MKCICSALRWAVYRWHKPRGGGGEGGGATTCQHHAGMGTTRNDVIQFLHRWSWETHFIVEMRDANEGSKIRNYWCVACCDFYFLIFFSRVVPAIRECDSFCVWHCCADYSDYDISRGRGVVVVGLWVLMWHRAAGRLRAKLWQAFDVVLIPLCTTMFASLAVKCSAHRDRTRCRQTDGQPVQDHHHDHDDILSVCNWQLEFSTRGSRF
jgi:hypothetical protein